MVRLSLDLEKDRMEHSKRREGARRQTAGVWGGRLPFPFIVSQVEGNWILARWGWGLEGPKKGKAPHLTREGMSSHKVKEKAGMSQSREARGPRARAPSSSQF